MRDKSEIKYTQSTYTKDVRTEWKFEYGDYFGEVYWEDEDLNYGEDPHYRAAVYKKVGNHMISYVPDTANETSDKIEAIAKTVELTVRASLGKWKCNGDRLSSTPSNESFRIRRAAEMSRTGEND